MSLRSLAAILTLGVALAGCVSKSAGRAEADALLAERMAPESRRPDDAQTAKARSAILGRPLTADAAARLAVLNHPDVDTAFAEIGVARGELISALTLPNPEVEASVKFHDGEAAWDLGASIDVTRFFRLATRGAAADDDLEATSIEAVGAVLDVALEAKRAYFGFVAARQVLELRKTSAFALAQSADAARRIHEAGNTPALDAAQEQVMFEESRLLVARAEIDETAARERLSAALGLFGQEASAWKAPERLPDPPERELPFEDVERRALERSLDLAALRKRYAAAAGRSDAAAWAWFPHLAAGAVAENDGGEWAFGPQIGVEIPIFDHGQGESAAAEASMLATQARVRSVATGLRATARTLGARLRAAREQTTFHRDTLLPLRQRVVDETMLQYNAMNAGIFQLLAAQRDQIEARRGHVEALRDYWIARAELEQLLAGRSVRVSAGATMDAPAASRGGGGH